MQCLMVEFLAINSDKLYMYFRKLFFGAFKSINLFQIKCIQVRGIKTSNITPADM